MVSPLKWQTAGKIYQSYFEQQSDFKTWLEFKDGIIKDNYSQISLDSGKFGLVVILKGNSIFVNLTDARCLFGKRLQNMIHHCHTGSWARLLGK